MTRDEQIRNLQELVGLLEDRRNREHASYGANYYGMNLREACQIFENAGLLRVYDTAIPQAWFDDFIARNGEPPRGIVWSYDTFKTFGGPFAVTQEAQRRLDQYQQAISHAR